MRLQAYQPTWAFCTALRSQAARWHRQQLLSAEQLAGIEVAYATDYYRPAWPLRVGLFLFTWFGLAMSGGLALLLSSGSPIASCLFCGGACFAVLELLIQDRRLYRCGIDNALLYAGLGAVIILIFYICYEYIWPISLHYDFDVAQGQLVVPLLLCLGVLGAATLRYADPLVATAAFAVALLLVVVLALQVAVGKTLLPFLLMATGAAALWLRHRVAARLAASPLADYYGSCLLVAKVLALAVLYLGGNYLVVREGNAALHGFSASVQVPFAGLFYFFTAALPLAYITLGLRRADRALLLMGLAALAFSLFTLRHYHSVLPPEVAATGAGLLLTGLAAVLLRRLRPARWGYTSEPDDAPQHLNLENFIQAQTAHVPGAPAGPSFAFGGGSSGGGGATGQL